MHCSLTGQPDRVPARYPPVRAVSNHSYNHSPASSDLSGSLFQTKALRKLYCQLTSPRIYQDVPFPSGEAACWSTCPSTHRQIIVCPPVRTQPHPNHPTFPSPQSNTLIFLSIFSCSPVQLPTCRARLLGSLLRGVIAALPNPRKSSPTMGR